MTDQPHPPASPDETPTTPAGPLHPEHTYASAPAMTPGPPIPPPGTAPTAAWSPAPPAAPPRHGTPVGLIIGAIVGGIVLLCLAFGAGGLAGWAVGSHFVEKASFTQQLGREQARDHLAPGQKRVPGQRQNGLGPTRTEPREGTEGRNGTTTPSPTPTPTPSPTL